MLGLDAAYPPSPQQWVADLNTVGADVAFYYAWGPIAKYSPNHIGAAKSAGKHTVAIIVSGNNPGDPTPMLNAVHALGGASDVVVFDIETGSLPPASWLGVALQTAKRAGHDVRRYGDKSVLDAYPWAGGDWISHAPGLAVRAGLVLPYPPVPSGYLAWQYAVNAIISGNSYDLSTVDPLFLGSGVYGGTDMAVILAVGDGLGAPDPRGSGAIYLVANWPFGPKVYIGDSGYVNALIPEVGQPQTKPQGLLDRCLDVTAGLPEGAGDYPHLDNALIAHGPAPDSEDPNSLSTLLGSIQAAVAAIQQSLTSQSGTSGGLTPAQAQQLEEVQANVAYLRGLVK